MTYYLLQMISQVSSFNKFSDIAEIQGQSECVTQKNVFNAKKK